MRYKRARRNSPPPPGGVVFAVFRRAKWVFFCPAGFAGKNTQQALAANSRSLDRAHPLLYSLVGGETCLDVFRDTLLNELNGKSRALGVQEQRRVRYYYYYRQGRRECR